MEQGYEFRWLPYAEPYFISPEGRKVQCKSGAVVQMDLKREVKLAGDDDYDSGVGW